MQMCSGIIRKYHGTNDPLREKTCFQGFMTRSNTNQAVLPQKMARGLKLWIYCTIYVAKTKALTCKTQVFS